MSLSIKNIPSDWELKNLGGVSTIIMGQSPSSNSYNEIGIGSYLIQGNADIKNRKSLPRQWTSEPTKICKIGDILMTVRAPVGAIAKSNHNACIGRGVCSIKSKNTDNEFLYQFLLSYESKWKSLEQGSTFTAVNGVDIRGINIPIPPLKEQQKIAEILSTVDAKISIIDAQISETQNLKKGLMQSLLSKGIGHTEFKKSALGEIPKSWEVLAIDDLFDFIPTKSLSRAQLNYNKGELLYIHYGDIHSTFKYPVLNVNEINLPRVNIEIDIKGNIEYLKQGDLILADASEDVVGIGKCIELNNLKNKKIIGGLHTIVMRDKLGKTADGFRTYLLTSPIILPSLKRIATGASVQGVSKGNLKKIKILIPPLKEQQKIASILSSVDEKLGVLSEKKSYYQNLKKGLMQQLLTGLVRVSV
ncbi:restriction endonuclease subunit S [Tenacibaculum finnmarkense]|uniref:restriction endonuclease subunit S n=1 Tax=Tenacibaculum finnmarkense TaxID=2781243 RepID=UPI00187BB655|nr:restriction endonuclease subunit S [Tenacibaculum finnmarkense]MBE7646810.1 hypothetical protein [Tenacibaculum finnmarkense genomovar ulcerans]MCD8422013.1 restriction endonuclease subunit S [Tenacibaculum finnmarkense genomovar ulcerans]MCG8238139.1 restriction endonuclease subunit S [Tenacibaculum finnmarkense genomovar ulcerans]